MNEDGKTTRRWPFYVIALLAVAGALFGLRRGPLINDVTTGETPAYPDLQPQRFETDRDAVLDAAVAALESLGIEVTARDRDAGTIRGVATTRMLRFKDDVTVTITSEGAVTTVSIRSASRVGRSDFGVNAKRNRAIQAAIAERL